MRIRHIFTILSVIVFIACVIVVLSDSDRSTAAPYDELKTQMQQEIVSALHEIVALREQELELVRAKYEAVLTSSLEMEEAQKKLSEARMRLATAEYKPDVAMEEFRKILAIQEQQLAVIQSKAEQGLAVSSDVVEMKLQLLEERVRLATAIRDMQ